MKQHSLTDSPLIFLIFCFVFALPFEYVGSFEYFGFTIRFSQLILLTIICLYPWYGSKVSPILFFFLSFWGVSLLSLLHTPDLTRSLVILAVTLGTASIAFFLPAIMKKEYQSQLMLFLVLVSVLVCLFGLYQFVGDYVGIPHTWTGIRATYSKEILGFPRMQSTFSEPLYFGNFLLLPVCLSILLFLQTKKRFYLLSLFLFILCVVLTVSRGAILAHLVSVSLLLWLLRHKFPLIKRYLVFWSIPSLFLLCWILFFSFDSLQPFITHLFTWFDGAAFVEREDTFSQAMQLIPQHPLVGWGLGSFGPISLQTNQMPDTGWPIVNNQYLETLMEQGVLGFICVFGFFIWVLRKKDDSLPCLAGKCALIGVLIQFMTFSTLYFMPVWFLIGFILL